MLYFVKKDMCYFHFGGNPQKSINTKYHENPELNSEFS